MSECCCVGMLLCWQGVMSGYVVVNGKTSGDERTDNHPIWCNPNSSRWLESHIQKSALSPTLSLTSISNVYHFKFLQNLLNISETLRELLLTANFVKAIENK